MLTRLFRKGRSVEHIPRKFTTSSALRHVSTDYEDVLRDELAYIALHLYPAIHTLVLRSLKSGTNRAQLTVYRWHGMLRISLITCRRTSCSEHDPIPVVPE